MAKSWLVSMGDEPSVELVGGKAIGLFRLVSMGLPVPRFVVLTAEAYHAVCSNGEVPGTLPAEIESLLDSIWTSFGSGAVPLAVRSSAVDEDSFERSFAGQMETFLNINDRAAFSQAVLGCWRSLRSARALTYRNLHNAIGEKDFQAAKPAMAVVIQEMISPDTAGVLFTVNPTNGRIDELLVSSVWGLGEGLVSGKLDGDAFVLERTGKVKSRRIAEKREKVADTPEGGIRYVSLPENMVFAPSLEDAILLDLVRQSLMAEDLAGRPLDIEFAVTGGIIYFLQARPVTGFTLQARPEDGHRLVWDNSNIIESYPGITLPLTFSFIRRAYQAVYRQFCQVLGLSEKEIRRHDHMLANMLGLINGRVYYNLLNWYKLVALLPGFRFNKGFMEAMMGLEDPDDLDERPLSRRERYLSELPRLLRAGFRAVCLHLSLPGRIESFHRDFNMAHARFSGIDFDSLAPHEVLRCYRDMEEEVLWKWKAPIINDFSAMIFYGLLKKLTVAWNVDPAGSLQNALISGQGDIESTQVSSQLLQVAQSIDTDPKFKEQFLNASPAEALHLIRNRQDIGGMFQRYLDKYGDRCVAELKLESKSMKDDPALCMAMIQNYLRTSIPAGDPRRETGLSEAAEAEITRCLKGRFTRSGISKLRLYRWVLKHARAAIRNRENQRFARTRAYALVRRMFRSVGRAFCRGGLLDHQGDIFYLELGEITSFIEGTATTQDLRSPARIRKAQYERYRSMSRLPDRLVTYGTVYAGNSFEGESSEGEDENFLTGAGACPGIVERSAVVMDELDISIGLSGEILVTHQTDPGWVVLFPSISGLVVERGSMLSHSAIVAREMGIPAVVGVRGATTRIRTGDLIRINGASGTVEILSARKEGAE